MGRTQSELVASKTRQWGDFIMDGRWRRACHIVKKRCRCRVVVISRTADAAVAAIMTVVAVGVGSIAILNRARGGGGAVGSDSGGIGSYEGGGVVFDYSGVEGGSTATAAGRGRGSRGSR